MQPGELEMDLTLAAVDFWEVGLGLRRTSCDLDPAFSIGVLLVHCYIIEKKINFYFCNVSTEDAGFRESFVERTQLLQCLRKPGLCTTSCSGFIIFSPHFIVRFMCRRSSPAQEQLCPVATSLKSGRVWPQWELKQNPGM